MTSNTQLHSTRPTPQQQVYAALGGHALTAHPVLTRRLGPSAAILLGQILYWHGKKASGEWIYKTVDDMERETGLTRFQQETAIRRCQVLGLLDVEVRGLPAKRHFRAHLSAVTSLAGSWQRRNSVGGTQSSLGDLPSRSTSETTQESTQEITAERAVELARNRHALDSLRADLTGKGILTATAEQSLS